MNITVNGSRWEVAEGLTLGDVVAELGARPEHVAVEYNGGIVDSSELGKLVLRASDRLEVVRFVGGG
jgi:thiamine biosynthesis protein ThiS